MKKGDQLYNQFLAILHEELKPAMGCTEPIAMAYAAAKARQTLGCIPDKIRLFVSGNIIKNVKGVLVPNSGGMKGVGALYCKQSIIKNLAPFIRGGGQENNLRSGTENVIGIAAFAAACEEFPKYKEEIKKVSDHTRTLLEKSDCNFKLNLPENKVDSILSVSIVGAKSEVVLNLLNGYGVCISAGSACSARKGHSGTLSAYGLQKNEIDGTVRISFGVGNTENEAEILVEKLEEAAKRLVKR